MFAHYYGVPEDPATGSAAGCLAGYLVRHRYYGEDEIEVRVEQGYEIGRPSLLRIRGVKMNTGIEVFVGGKVIPVVDLRLKFGLEGKDDTDRTCIIVVQVTGQSRQVTMGIIVDEVSEVLDIEGEQIEPPPSFGAAV